MKALKIISKILGGLLVAVLIVIIGAKVLGLVMFKDFYSKATKEYKIPGLNEKFIPQGLTYDAQSETFITCGYISGGNSVIYTINDENKGKRVYMQNMAGEACVDHFGGCSIYKDYLLICGGDGSSNGRQFLYTYSLSEVLAAGKDDTVKALAETDVATGAAFVYVVNDSVYVGEFNHNGSEVYELKNENHFFKVSDTKTNKAIMLLYDLNADGTIKATPKSAYSIPDDVQGMCVDDLGNIYFSASWAVNPSLLYKYEKLPTFSTQILDVNGTNVPLWVFDDEPKEVIKTSPMLEEIVYVDGKIYTMNESASSKYIFGKLFRGSYMYSYDTKK